MRLSECTGCPIKRDHIHCYVIISTTTRNLEANFFLQQYLKSNADAHRPGVHSIRPAASCSKSVNFGTKVAFMHCHSAKLDINATIQCRRPISKIRSASGGREGEAQLPTNYPAPPLAASPPPQTGHTHIVAYHSGATFVCGPTLQTICAPQTCRT